MPANHHHHGFHNRSAEHDNHPADHLHGSAEHYDHDHGGAHHHHGDDGSTLYHDKSTPSHLLNNDAPAHKHNYDDLYQHDDYDDYRPILYGPADHDHD